MKENFDFSVGIDGEDLKFIDPQELLIFDDIQAKKAYNFHERLQERLDRYRGDYDARIA